MRFQILSPAGETLHCTAEVIPAGISGYRTVMGDDPDTIHALDLLGYDEVERAAIEVWLWDRVEGSAW